jgi:hypothetical protein
MTSMSIVFSKTDHRGKHNMAKNKKTEIIIRSSAAEYLTFVASTGDSRDSIEIRYEDENIWLTQKMMATLYDVEVPTINYHIKKVFVDSELLPEATIRKFLIVQGEGGRQVSREVDHYALQMIIAVRFQGQFRACGAVRKVPRRSGQAFHVRL